MFEALRIIGEKILSLGYPHGLTCSSCGDELMPEGQSFGGDEHGSAFCEKCVDQLEFIGEDRCIKCGGKIEGMAATCRRCQRLETHFRQAISVFEYKGLAKKLILLYKGDRRAYLAKDFAPFMYETYEACGFQVDAVVNVPTRKEKLWERGFDQTKELAKEFCKRSGLPLLEGVLTCSGKRHTDQKSLKLKERAENAKGSFKLLDRGAVKGKRILLIDDIITTGVTVNECARELMKGKPKFVNVLTVCSTSIEPIFD